MEPSQELWHQLEQLRSEFREADQDTEQWLGAIEERCDANELGTEQTDALLAAGRVVAWSHLGRSSLARSGSGRRRLACSDTRAGREAQVNARLLHV